MYVAPSLPFLHPDVHLTYHSTELSSGPTLHELHTLITSTSRTIHADNREAALTSNFVDSG